MNDVMENLIKQAQQIEPAAFKGLNESHESTRPVFATQPPIYSFKRLNQLRDLSCAKWLLSNLLIEQGITVLYAQPGVGKSFFAIDAAMQVAQECPVAYVASEGQRSIGKRFDAWCTFHQQQEGEIFFVGETLYLLEDESIGAFIAGCEPLGIKLIVIDTLANALVGGDENSAKDMGRAIENLKWLRDELNTAILIVHHTGKSGASERGSSALRGGADIMIELVERDEAIEVICSKMKDYEEFERHFVKLHVVELPQRDADTGTLLTSCVVVPTVKQTSNNGLSKAQREVLDLLSLGIFREAGARSNQLFDALSMSRSNFYQVLSSLKQKKFIEQDSKGDPYTITQKGVDSLGIVEEVIASSEELRQATTSPRSASPVQVQQQSNWTDRTMASSPSPSLVPSRESLDSGLDWTGNTGDKTADTAPDG